MSVPNKNRFECPVCGYDKLIDEPREGEICPSCGTQFDSEGFDLEPHELRAKWIDRGMPWFSRGKGKPKDWSPVHQLIIAGYGEDLIRHERMKTDEAYRYAVDEAFSDVRIAKQLRLLRENRKEPLTQSALAEKAEMKQSRISELEGMNYSSWTVSTLRRLAQALGVRFTFAFEGWRDLGPEIDSGLTPEELWIPSFEDEPVLPDVETTAIVSSGGYATYLYVTHPDADHVMGFEMLERLSVEHFRPKSRLTHYESSAVAATEPIIHSQSNLDDYEQPIVAEPALLPGLFTKGTSTSAPLISELVN